MRISVKPMSMNMAYRGRRFKTALYKTYEKECYCLLPDFEVPEGKLWITIDIGVSNRGFDADNAVKPFIDILQKKYGFNDNRIYLLHVKKEIVEKGNEFIDFEIINYKED